MQPTISDICDEMRKHLQEQYTKGVRDVLLLLNKKYLIKVWHREDAEKFFDDVMETLRDLNLQFNDVFTSDEK